MLLTMMAVGSGGGGGLSPFEIAPYTGNTNPKTIGTLDMSSGGFFQGVGYNGSVACGSVGVASHDGTTEVSLNSETPAVNFTPAGVGHNGANQLDNRAGYTYRGVLIPKAPQILDVVTYVGTGAARDLAHALGTLPGLFIIKNPGTPLSWSTARAGKRQVWGAIYGDEVADTTFSAITASHLSFSGSFMNEAGVTYVAVIFAADSAHCFSGFYTGSGASGKAVSVPFRPKLVWLLPCLPGGNPPLLMGGVTDDMVGVEWPQRFGSEAGDASLDIIEFTSSGFVLNSNNRSSNRSGYPYRFLALG